MHVIMHPHRTATKVETRGPVGPVTPRVAYYVLPHIPMELRIPTLGANMVSLERDRV